MNGLVAALRVATARPSDGKETTAHMVQKAIVGEKVGMTQVWDDDNKIVPVTVVKVTPCRVVQVKTPETDGYAAIQVTIGSKEARKLSKPEAGHFASAGVEPGQRTGRAAGRGHLGVPGRSRVRG